MKLAPKMRLKLAGAAFKGNGMLVDVQHVRRSVSAIR